SASIGIANLLSLVISKESGCTIEEARSHIWLVDSKVLVTYDRLATLDKSKKTFAHKVVGRTSDPKNLASIITGLQPNVLVGLSAKKGAFNQQVIEAMPKVTETPIIFALSNPTSKSECTAADAYQWSQSRCIFASGSPYDS